MGTATAIRCCVCGGRPGLTVAAWSVGVAVGPSAPVNCGTSAMTTSTGRSIGAPSIGGVIGRRTGAHCRRRPIRRRSVGSRGCGDGWLMAVRSAITIDPVTAAAVAQVAEWGVAWCRSNGVTLPVEVLEAIADLRAASSVSVPHGIAAEQASGIMSGMDSATAAALLGVTPRRVTAMCAAVSWRRNALRPAGGSTRRAWRKG